MCKYLVSFESIYLNKELVNFKVDMLESSNFQDKKKISKLIVP